MPTGTRNPAELQLVDPVLTNLAQAYVPGGFVYDQITTDLNVTTDTGLYPEWSLDDLYRDDVEDIVGDRAETPEIDFGYRLQPYALTPRRLKVTISDTERGQAHSALRFEEMKVRGLMARFALRRERRLAAKLRAVSNGGQLTSGGTVANKWNTTSATIERDIKAARKAVRDLCGQWCTHIVMDWEVAYEIALNQGIRDILRETPLAEQLIVQGDRVLPRNLHGLEVVIAGGQYNAANKGAARSLQTIWSDSVRLVKVGETDSWEPATVYNLRGLVGNQSSPGGSGDGEDGQTPGGVLVDRWRTPDPPVDHIRAWENCDEKVVAADIGYEIVDVL